MTAAEDMTGSALSLSFPVDVVVSVKAGINSPRRPPSILSEQRWFNQSSLLSTYTPRQLRVSTWPALSAYFPPNAGRF